MPFLLEQLNDGSTADRNFRALARDMNPPVPQTQVSNSGAQAITPATLTALTFNQEGFDNGTLHDNAVNAGRLAAPIAGLYLVGCNVGWASNPTGYRFITLRINGTTTRIAADSRPAVNGDTTYQSVSTLWHFAATEYFEVHVFQNSGGNLNVLANAATEPSPVAYMVRLGGFVNQGV